MKAMSAIVRVWSRASARTYAPTNTDCIL